MPADRLGNMPPRGRAVAAGVCRPVAFPGGCDRLGEGVEVAERCGAFDDELAVDCAVDLAV
jgi:hypothetical protein